MDKDIEDEQQLPTCMKVAVVHATSLAKTLHSVPVVPSNQCSQ